MRNDNLNVFSKVIIAIILLLLVLFLFYRQKQDIYVLEETTVSGKKAPVEKLVVVSNPRPLIKKDKVLPPRMARKVIIEDSHVVSSIYGYRIEQEMLRSDYMNLVKLYVSLPKDMHYFNHDIEEGVATIYGTSLDGKRQLALVATQGERSLEDALEFLRTNKDALPVLQDRKIDAEKVFTMKAPADSGLNDLQVLPTTGASGAASDAYVAFAQRKDGAGTYLFMMRAPNQYFQDNADDLGMLKTVKVKP